MFPLFLLCLTIRAIAIVIGPNLPINITIIIVIFPVILNNGVMPKVVPTVANADMVSKKNFHKSKVFR